MKKKIEEIENTGGASSNQIWKVRKTIKAKNTDQGHTVKDPVTEERKWEPEDIKKCYAEYFKMLLSPNDRKHDLEKVYSLIEEIHSIRMDDSKIEDDELVMKVNTWKCVTTCRRKRVQDRMEYRMKHSNTREKI